MMPHTLKQRLYANSSRVSVNRKRRRSERIKRNTEQLIRTPAFSMYFYINTTDLRLKLHFSQNFQTENNNFKTLTSSTSQSQAVSNKQVAELRQSDDKSDRRQNSRFFEIPQSMRRN